MTKAIFLDRDGVINYPVLDPNTKEYAAPWNPDDFILCEGVIESLKTLIDTGFKLFIVTNQPDYAKGKTNLENLKLVHNKMHSIFMENNIKFTDYYYCYHHPQGIVPEYSIRCQCRKPGNLFLKQAETKYGLNLVDSWMIGDRDVDIYCGQSAGTRTIMINLKESRDRATSSNPDYKVNSLREAVEIVRKESENWRAGELENQGMEKGYTKRQE